MEWNRGNYFVCFETKDVKILESGREEGIRTLESLHFTRVPGVLLQPLGHLSKIALI